MYHFTKGMNGSWEEMLTWVYEEGSYEHEIDIPIIWKLKCYEQKYDVNLGDLLGIE